MTTQNLTPDIEDFKYDPNIIEVVKTGNEFCKLVENPNQNDTPTFVKNTLQSASRLYTASLAVAPPDDLPEETTQKFVAEADWVYIENATREKLGENNRLVDLREPEHPEETTETEISECLADVYQTIKDFILLYELDYDNAMLAGIKEYLDLFRYHTGHRLLLIMSELHDLAFNVDDLEEAQPQHSHDHSQCHSHDHSHDHSHSHECHDPHCHNHTENDDDNRWITNLFNK